MNEKQIYPYNCEKCGVLVKAHEPLLPGEKIICKVCIKQEEKIYMNGEGEALKSIILYCQSKLKSLGIEMKSDEQFSVERVDIIKTLRDLCDEYGDNDWDDNLHIGDILRNHLRFDNV